MQVQEELPAVRVAAHARAQVRFPVPARFGPGAEREALAQLVFGRSCRRRVVAPLGAPRARRTVG